MAAHTSRLLSCPLVHHPPTSRRRTCHVVHCCVLLIKRPRCGFYYYRAIANRCSRTPTSTTTTTTTRPTSADPSHSKLQQIVHLTRRPLCRPPPFTVGGRGGLERISKNNNNNNDRPREQIAEQVPVPRERKTGSEVLKQERPAPI